VVNAAAGISKERSLALATRMGETSRLERPAVAAELIAKASKSDKEAIALELVQIAARTTPDLLAAVVGSVIAEVPSAAAKIASTAVQASPSSLFEVAKAAAAAAPKQAEKIALALAALQPNELLKVCLAIGQGAPSEAPRVVGPISRAFIDQFDKVFAGLAYGAPQQVDSISQALVVAIPALDQTSFGSEVRMSRGASAGGASTTKRKVAVAQATLNVLTALVAKIKEEAQKQVDAAVKAAQSSSSSGTPIVAPVVKFDVASLVNKIESGDVKVSDTGAITLSPKALEGAVTGGSSSVKVETTAIANSATESIKKEVSNANSALSSAIQTAKEATEKVSNEEAVRIILDKNTVRAYSKPE